MRGTRRWWLLSVVCCAAAEVRGQLPSPELFAPGVISGPANDGSPVFTPDGHTLYFTRSTAGWAVILESHRTNGHWSTPEIAPFSGEWYDSSPGIAPDGSYLVFVSVRQHVANLYRVNREGAGWSAPARLPDAVNIGHCSSGRLKDDPKDHLFFVRRDGADWGPVTPIRYAGDSTAAGYSTDDEPHLGPDHHTLYFSSDRGVPVHFPRTRAQAQADLQRLDMWDNSNSNVWSIPIDAIVGSTVRPNAR